LDEGAFQVIKIYSKVNSELIHLIVTSEDFTQSRLDLSTHEKFLQCAMLNLNKGKTFIPHKHNLKSFSSDKFIAQESWCVISGKVKVLFFDTDDKFISSHILNPGDISITYFGGHTYEILEDGTKVYEYKTGPYENVDKDKTYLNLN
jgi:cupin fold WbuC family metalloprotein